MNIYRFALLKYLDIMLIDDIIILLQQTYANILSTDTNFNFILKRYIRKRSACRYTDFCSTPDLFLSSALCLQKTIKIFTRNLMYNVHHDYETFYKIPIYNLEYVINKMQPFDMCPEYTVKINEIYKERKKYNIGNNGIQVWHQAETYDQLLYNEYMLKNMADI